MPETSTCRCTIGQHAAVASIDADLRAGGPHHSLGKIAERYDVAKPTVGRHRLKCLGLGGNTPETTPETAHRASPPPPKDRSRGRREPASPPPETPRRPVAETAETPPAAAAPGPPKPPRAAPAGRRLGELPPGAPAKEDRVRHIIGLMSRLQWEDGVTGPLLAAEWELHPGTLEHDAAEASRYIKRLVDPTQVMGRLLAALDEGVDLALVLARPSKKGDREISGDPKALGALASLAQTMAKISGGREKPGSTAADRPVLHIHYPEGMAPAPPDGDPPQPPPGAGAPGADAGT